ncbi:MAG: hypothetical protein IJ713_00405 [Oscillibacter sp.]|nr:hypothetical protein [Oscillibacter sp.]
MANFAEDKGLAYLWTKIRGSYVAKERGKGLSTNDYTTAERDKLRGVASGAQVNRIETVRLNGRALPVYGKAVDVNVPIGEGSDMEAMSNKEIEEIIKRSV